MEHWLAMRGQSCIVHEFCRKGQCAYKGENTGGLQQPTDKLFRCVCTQYRSVPFILCYCKDHHCTFVLWTIISVEIKQTMKISNVWSSNTNCWMMKKNTFSCWQNKRRLMHFNVVFLSTMKYYPMLTWLRIILSFSNRKSNFKKEIQGER